MNVSAIRRLAESARPDLPSYQNCYAINKAIANALRDQPYIVKLVEGSLTRYGLRGEGPEHAFVVIERDENQPVIVDGAVQQFCDERKDAGEVFFSLGSRASLPAVAVLTPTDDLYDQYLF